MDEQQVWETILLQHGLSMDRGANPKWMQYGWQYRDTDRPVMFSATTKARSKKDLQNETLATALLAEMAKGQSLNAAAKTLGVSSGSASKSVRRFNQRVQNLPAADSAQLRKRTK